MKWGLDQGLVVACVLVAAALPAVAQTTAPREPSVKNSKDAKDKKDEKADAETMERVRRLASNPMRMIIEASRVRRRGDAEAAPPVPVTATASTMVATASGAEVTTRAVPPPAPAAPAPEAPVIAVLGSQLMQVRGGSSAPVLDVAGGLQPVVQSLLPQAPPAQPLVSLKAPVPEVVRPTIVNRVDPDPPQRLLAEIDPNTVVTVDLTIQPDGSVSQVSLVNPSPRSLVRYVVSALQQWRFAPLPSERQWRVELLFRPD